MKILKAFLCALLSVLILTLPVLAHSGRTDSSGGHRDNKNVSGLGSYHYHHGYGPHLHPNGVCPYSTTATPAPAVSPAPAIPGAPAVSDKTDAEKADFLDRYIALIQSGQTIYHTLDCADFDQTKEFVAYNLAIAKEKQYTACTKCHE